MFVLRVPAPSLSAKFHTGVRLSKVYKHQLTQVSQVSRLSELLEINSLHPNVKF